MKAVALAWCATGARAATFSNRRSTSASSSSRPARAAARRWATRRVNARRRLVLAAQRLMEGAIEALYTNGVDVAEIEAAVRGVVADLEAESSE